MRAGSRSPAFAGAGASRGSTPRTTRSSRRASRGTGASRARRRSCSRRIPSTSCGTSRRRCWACTAARTPAFPNEGVERMRAALKAAGKPGRDPHLSGRAACLLRRLPAVVSPAGCRGRLAAAARLVAQARRRLAARGERGTQRERRGHPDSRGRVAAAAPGAGRARAHDRVPAHLRLPRGPHAGLRGAGARPRGLAHAGAGRALRRRPGREPRRSSSTSSASARSCATSRPARLAGSVFLNVSPQLIVAARPRPGARRALHGAARARARSRGDRAHRGLSRRWISASSTSR